jgi:dimethylamine/trimethylamine dehydrogenase
MERLGNVEQAFDSELTADEIASYEFDHVALATGARWRADGVGRWHTSPIEIDASMPVLTPDDLMAGRTPAGERVVLFDDDHYYMGGVLAELLAAAGHAVTLVTPEARVSDWTQATMEQHRIQKRLLEAGVTAMTTHTLVSAAPGSATVACAYTEQEQQLPCDALVLVTSRLPSDALLEPLRGAGVAVRAIGDALSPGTIAAAVWDGRRFAEELDDPAADDRDRPPFLREVVQLAPDEAAVASG